MQVTGGGRSLLFLHYFYPRPPQGGDLAGSFRLFAQKCLKPLPYFEDIKTTCLSRLFALLRYTYQDPRGPQKYGTAPLERRL